MKRWATISLGSILCLTIVSSTALADDVNPATVPTAVSDQLNPEQQKEQQQKKTEISALRKVAGYGVLGFLLVWLFLRGKKKEMPVEESEEEGTSEDENESENEDGILEDASTEKDTSRP
ncbi:MAG: hypothetical protein RR808_03600 [Akkermansia sp.]